MAFDEAKMEEYIGGIIAENRDHPILKNKVKLCNKCALRMPKTATCEKYPQGIPHEVAVGRPLCKAFVEKK